MSENKQDLVKLLDFIIEISSTPNNNWFRKELVNKLVPLTASKSGNNPEISEIHEYCIKKILQDQAKMFYKDFNLPSINDELCNDFVRMEQYRREDNFEEFFGAFGAGQRGHRPATHARISLWVTLEDVARGGPKIISLQMGRAASNVEINIPTGIEEGDTIRYAGLSPDGQDLIISYRIKPHDVWQRNRKDITAEQQIPLWDLILGGEVTIRDLLNNEMVITVPAKTQPGSLLRLRGRGLPPSSIPGKQTHGVGDLFVRVQALMPSQFSPALITAIEQERNQ